MASVYSSDQVTNSLVPLGKEPGDIKCVVGTFELTTALIVGDVIQMVTLPANHRFTDGWLFTDDLETTGTNLTIDVGVTGGTVDLYLANSTIGQAGGYVEFGAIGVVAGAAFDVAAATADDTIDILVATAPATGAATGTIRMGIYYKVVDSQGD